MLAAAGMLAGRRATCHWRYLDKRRGRGGGSHAFLVPLNGLGRAQLRSRGAFGARLLAAIPGGRLQHGLRLGRPR
jgi:hypothetical protein